MKKIFVTRPSMPSLEEYIEEIRSIWQTKHITNFGPKYNEFKSLIQNEFGYHYVDLQCNGHMTLQNVLSTIEPGEIITTPFTFVSTTLAIINSGHIPVFCDIKKDDFNIDPDKIEDLITEKTVAIVPVHVYGSPCDVDRIQAIAVKHGLKVIYDAAHAFGVRIGDNNIGNYGDASVFSFHATKVFNTIEGGMCVSSHKDLIDEIMIRSNFGQSEGDFLYNGVNSKMNEFQAAMGIANFHHYKDNIRKRKEISDLYDKLLNEVTVIRTLKRDWAITYNYAYYPIFIDNRASTAEDLKNYLESEGFFCRRYFYPLTSTLHSIRTQKNDTVIAASVSENILCLPIYPELGKNDVIMICDCILRYFENE